MAEGNVAVIRCKLTTDATNERRNALHVGDVITAGLGFGLIVYSQDDQGLGRAGIEAIVDLEIPSERVDDACEYLEACDDVRIYEVRS